MTFQIGQKVRTLLTDQIATVKGVLDSMIEVQYDDGSRGVLASECFEPLSTEYLTPNEAGIDSSKENCEGIIAAFLEVTDYMSNWNFGGQGVNDISNFRQDFIQKLKDSGYEIRKSLDDHWIVNGQYVNVAWSSHKIK